MTFIGLYIPACFTEILGAALTSISDPAYVSALANGSTAGLIAQVVTPWHGGGKVILVLLAGSVLYVSKSDFAGLLWTHKLFIERITSSTPIQQAYQSKHSDVRSPRFLDSFGPSFASPSTQ